MTTPDPRDLAIDAYRLWARPNTPHGTRTEAELECFANILEEKCEAVGESDILALFTESAAILRFLARRQTRYGSDPMCPDEVQAITCAIKEWALAL